jgi:hypothetical protein
MTETYFPKKQVSFAEFFDAEIEGLVKSLQAGHCEERFCDKTIP